MAKVVGSYASVTRGVSEQVPQDRHPGQMWEQVNMISDPVVGLARRPGSVLKDTKVITGVNAITPALKADIKLYREYTFFKAGKEYVLLYRSSAAGSPNALPAFLCYCKTDGKFLNTWFADGNSANQAAAAGLAPWINGGVSALTTVGDYLVLAANTLGPGYSLTDNYAASNQRAIAWVRGGAYSRTYTLRVTRRSDGASITSTYTTMASSYPNLLDTSDIPVSGNDQYQKQVNDRVNANNSAVNAWIGQAQQSITPANIAGNLIAGLSAQGFTSLGQIGGTIILDNVSYVSTDDAGDGTLFRSVFNTLDDVGKLSSIHIDGKVVQVKANNQVDPFYMVFKADKPGDWSTGRWVEGPAQIIQPGQVFAVASITADGANFVIGSSPTVLNNQGSGFTCPQFAGSVCGDTNQTGAIPYFFGRKVTLLTMFQDRLVIVADGTIFMSRTGDYFNWFRKTMLSVQDDDPIEAYALGASDDRISKCVTYNKNLFMFGERNQYSISGTVVASPATISVATVASERDAMYCQPATSGNLIFYGSQAVGSGDHPYSGIINQFQLGLFQDTPETYQISKQLSKYISGRPIEMAAISSPPAMFVRTDDYDGFYVYSYIDAAGSQERQFDSWGRWVMSPAMGQLTAFTSYQQRLLTFWFKPETANGTGTNLLLVCNEFSMDTTDRTRPYLDSQRPMSQTTGDIGAILSADPAKMWADAYASVDITQPEFLIHSTVAKLDGLKSQYPAIAPANFVGGFDYDSYVTLTSPYVRDSNDKAIVNGRLVVNKYTVSFTQSGGVDVRLTDHNGTDKLLREFNGRLVGHSNNLVGRIPISTTNFSVPVGRANTEHQITFHSKTCLPMTISAIEWVGQFFTSGRRV